MLKRLPPIAILPIVAVLVGVAAMVALTVPSVPDEAAKPAEDPVVATVDGQSILRSEVVESAKGLPPEYQAQLQQIMPALIERQVDLKLLSDKGYEEGLEDDEQVKRTLKRLEQDVVRETYLTRYLKEQVTEEKLRQRYEEFLKANPPEPEVHARHILVESEEEAKATIKEIAGGKDFVALADEKSNSPSGRNGGDLGYFTRKEMVPEFAEAAFAMKPGDVSKTPVKTQFGWHVIKVEDRRERQPPTFEEAKPQLENELQQELVTALIKELRAGAKIEIFNPDGTPLSAAPPADAADPEDATGTATEGGAAGAAAPAP